MISFKPQAPLRTLSRKLPSYNQLLFLNQLSTSQLPLPSCAFPWSLIWNMLNVVRRKTATWYIELRMLITTNPGAWWTSNASKVIVFLDICLRYIYSSLNNNPVTFWITLPIDNFFLTLSINIASRFTWNCNLRSLCIGPALHNLHLIEVVTILIKFCLHWWRRATADVISLGEFLSPGNWASSEQCWENEGHQRV